ncbi:protein YdaY [Escherichia coli]
MSSGAKVNDQYRSRNALIRRHIEKMDASLHVGTKEFDISKVSEVDSVDDLLIDNAARYLLKDWKGVGELVNGVEVALEYTAERGIALLKQNPELYWQILAEAASIAQGKEQQKQDTIKKP